MLRKLGGVLLCIIPVMLKAHERHDSFSLSLTFPITIKYSSQYNIIEWITLQRYTLSVKYIIIKLSGDTNQIEKEDTVRICEMFKVNISKLHRDSIFSIPDLSKDTHVFTPQPCCCIPLLNGALNIYGNGHKHFYYTGWSPDPVSDEIFQILNKDLPDKYKILYLLPDPENMDKLLKDIRNNE